MGPTVSTDTKLLDAQNSPSLRLIGFANVYRNTNLMYYRQTIHVTLTQ